MLRFNGLRYFFPSLAQMLLAIFLRRNRKLPLKPTSTLRSGLTTRNTLLFRKNLTCLGRTLAFAGALAFGLAAQQGQAAVIFDNLSASAGLYGYGSMGVSNTQSSAQGFSTTATDFVLTGVQLRLYNMSGTTGGYELQLWDATGSSGSPGVQIGAALYNGLAQNLTASPPPIGSLLSVTGLNRTLAANTTYYLVVAGTSLTSVALPGLAIPGLSLQGTLAWSTVASSPAGGAGSFAKSSTWVSLSGYGMMKIEAGPGGAASVPDAGRTPAALGVVLAGLATLRRRLQP
jgi:hypothetical protein